RLVEMMGGAIWVESMEGKGSTFHFTIQLQAHPETCYHHFTPPHENIRVLIVEDNPTASLYMQRMLLHFGMQPVVVTNGEQALIELTRAVNVNEPYSLILLDISLPGNLDGFDVAKAIMKNERFDGTSVIVTSMSQKTEDIKRFTSLGITEYFSKPFSQSDLLDSIQNLLNHTNALPANNYFHTGAARHSLSESSSTCNPLHILLAEDNLVNQEVTSNMLIKNGHTVTIAKNGEEAIQAVKEKNFDLVLMDVQMPVKNGYEATQAIRQMETITGRHIHIIGLTANAMSGDREKCLHAGMDDYISKPVRME